MSTKESGNENETGASGMLRQTSTMIAKMAAYFDSMVDRRNDRFYYRCLPNSGTKIHGHCPIRDLGSAWDTTNLLRSSSTAAGPSKNLSQQYPHLAKAVTSTIHAYVPKDMSWQTFTNARDQPCAALPSRLLLEPSNVAHSAFFILALTGALQLELFESLPPSIPLDALVNGILSMQQEETGAFAIHFEDKQHDIFRGIEFYPGEAMLAVLDAYQEVPSLLSPTTRQSIVPAVQRAFLFYSNFYRDGNVDEHYTSFFGNWQVQCFGKLHDILASQEKEMNGSGVTAAKVAEYLVELCDAIVNSSSWQFLDQGRYKLLSTVEIA